MKSPEFSNKVQNISIDYFRKIVESDEGQTVVLCGAGVSMIPPSSLPSGDKLRDDCVEAIVSGGSLTSDLKEIMRSNSYKALLPEVVFQDVAYFAPSHLDRLVAKKFMNIAPNGIHHEISRRFPYIFTTNFDLCIDQSSNKKVYHLHGSIDKPSSLQNRLFRLGQTAKKDALRFKEVVSGKNLLVVGYSFRDTDIISLVEESKLKKILFLSFDETVPTYFQLSKHDCVYAIGGVHELFSRRRISCLPLLTTVNNDFSIRKPSIGVRVNIILYLCFRAGLTQKAQRILLTHLPLLNGRLKYKAIATTVNCLRLSGEFRQAIEYCIRYQTNSLVMKPENADIASSFCVNRGLCYLEEGGELSIQAESLFRKGLDFVDVFAKYHDGHKISDAIIVGSIIWKARIFNNLGWCFALRDEHKKALSYYNKSQKIMQRFSEEVGIAQVYINIAVSALRISRFDMAKEMIQRTFITMSKTPDTYICRDALYGSLRAIDAFASFLDNSHSAQGGLEICEDIWVKMYNAAKKTSFIHSELITILDSIKKFAILLKKIDGYSNSSDIVLN